MLWRLRSVPGLYEWINRARNAEFEAAYFELYWLSRFAGVFKHVEFNVASLKKGLDFDLLLHDGLGYLEVCAEVKSRTQPLHNGSAVRRFLGKAKEQLPKGKQGVIVFKLAREENIEQDELDAACQSFLNSTSRVQFVGYCFELDRDPLALRFGHRCVTKLGRNDGLIPIERRMDVPANFLRDTYAVWSSLFDPFRSQL